jgi:phosphonate transport system ATP-binding protein
VTAPPPALELRSAEVVYANGTRALWPATLSFDEGCFTVLLGASGAGKSTLLRCLNGLVTPTRGTLVARGLGEVRDPAQRRALRATTGMVFQQHHLIGRCSVLHNVLMGRLGHRTGWASLLPWGRQDKTLALAAIDRVGLLERALQRADQLSGGQQQRVGVARALVQQPRVLLADEPVASLDPATAERLLALMHDICRRERLCVVVSLHQVAFARAFADRIVGLRHGAVVFDSATAALSDETLDALYGDGGFGPADAPPPDAGSGTSAARAKPAARAELATTSTSTRATTPSTP